MRIRWLETESDGSSLLFLWCLICWGVGIAVYLNQGWVPGIISFVLTMVLIEFATQVVAWLRIPKTALYAVDDAVAAFECAYPNVQITSVAIRAIEAVRYIYSVRYKSPGQVSFPEARRYFAVSQSNSLGVIELDTAEWWPRGLK